MQGGDGMGRVGRGWDESKKSKLIPALRCKDKITPHSRPTTFAEQGKPTWGEVGWDRAKLSPLYMCAYPSI